MIRIERTFDMETVRRLVTMPRVYRISSDDGSPAPEDFVPVDSPRLWYLLAYDDDILLALVPFYPENSVSAQVHICPLPSVLALKGLARDTLRAAIEWMWANSICLRVTAKVPSFNRLAIKLAGDVGMMEMGVDKHSFMKAGNLYDQVMFGISSPEVV